MEPLSPQDPKNIGPWKLLNRIGAGGMGVVFYAEQKTKNGHFDFDLLGDTVLIQHGIIQKEIM